MAKKPHPEARYCPHCGHDGIKATVPRAYYMCLSCRAGFELRFSRWIRKAPGKRTEEGK